MSAVCKSAHYFVLPLQQSSVLKWRNLIKLQRRPNTYKFNQISFPDHLYESQAPHKDTSPPHALPTAFSCFVYFLEI